MGHNSLGIAGKIFARVALPVTAVDKDEARRLWRSGGIEIETLPGPRTVGHIEGAGMGCAKHRGSRVAPIDQSGTIGNRSIIVVGGVAFRPAQRRPSGEHRDG
jgi:hypothetical protein